VTKGDLVAKKSIQADRQARVEQMRAAQKAKDRRNTILVAVAAGAVVVVLIALVVVVIRDYRQENPDDLGMVGVEADAASCDEAVTEPATGVNEHVGPGTETPDTAAVEYGSVPPTFGQHFAQPIVPAEPFYTAENRPAVENLVHNLEHGYTVLWYSEDLPTEQQDDLRLISDLARDLEETGGGKFIVSAWDDAYGELPDGKNVALAHWGASDGTSQLCGEVSGAVVEQFVTDNPSSDSPEPEAG
jgi:hypothetical protein